MRSKHVSSTAPMLSRPSAPAHAACSQAPVVASNAASQAGMPPRKAAGAQPPCVSRGRRVPNALRVSTPPPRLSPKG